MSPQKLASQLAISESGFLFLTTTGETFTANPVAREILLALQATRDESEILAMIQRDYDVDPTTAERDLRDFMAQLDMHGLLTREP
jgi:hypothetical protein